MPGFPGRRTSAALRWLVALLVLIFPALPAAGAPSDVRGPSPATSGSAGHGFSLHQIHHVWLILLENEDEATTFGSPKTYPYLAGTLRRKGLLLTNYYATGHLSADNYISLTSGQAPNSATQGDCQRYVDFPTGWQSTPGEPHQQAGVGCVYPRQVNDIGNQLSHVGKRWKAFMQDMGNIPSREAAACGHPAVGSQDNTQTAVNGDGYATRHDPFVYYHRVIDRKRYCQRHVVALGSPSGTMPKAAVKGEHGLAWTLAKRSRTPAYSFITPNLCQDGHDDPCKNEKGWGSAAADIDHFLKTWVPRIMHSAAYRHGGLIEITFDEAEGPQSDSSACCGEGPDPNAIGMQAGITGPGGGKVGALLLSPLLRPGSRSTTPYNHYSTLATDEAIFGLPRLGYATGAQTFQAALAKAAR